jgi:ABC-type multidrug transport system fused ATPase/permease subunit
MPERSQTAGSARAHDDASIADCLRILLPLVPAKEKRRFLFLLLLAVVMALTELFLTGMVALFAAIFGSPETVLNNNPLLWIRTHMGIAFGDDPRLLALWVLVSVLLAIVLKNALTIFQQWHLSTFSETVGRIARGHIFRFYQRAPFLWLMRAGVADLGFGLDAADADKAEQDWKRIKSGIMEAVKKTFRPEFLNRVDDIVVFKPLDKGELLQITEFMLKDVVRRAAAQDVDLSINEGACQVLLDEGFDPKYGARPLRRTIQRMVEDKLADMLLEGSIASGDHVSLVTSLKPEGPDSDKYELCFNKE